MANYPKVLVVSNNSFSRNNSNGRTLGVLFGEWPKSKLAQFCISTTEPDYDICDNYYVVTDKNAFQSFIHFRKAKGQKIENCINTAANTRIISTKPTFKTATKALIRQLIWSNRWNSTQFWQWVDEFHPDVVLVMYSDSSFILQIAQKVSEKKNIPLVMYNTEGFYFFEHDFMQESNVFDRLNYYIYHKLHRHEVRKLMSHTTLSIHLNGKLKKDFLHEFGGRHEVIYNSSSMEYRAYKAPAIPKFNYLGNFGFDRVSSLVEIADVLHEINPDYKLHIYGKIPTIEIEEKFNSNPNIILEGFIRYDKVQEIMYGSTILFHAESFSPIYEENLRYGFTTKIADSLMSGVPFLMYSLPSVAGADYLMETGAGWYASNKQELKSCIVEILNNAEKRTTILKKAKEISFQNHSDVKNREKFQTLLSRL